jgi:hypothetical protein
MVTGPNWALYQEWLCWRGPAVILWTELDLHVVCVYDVLSVVAARLPDSLCTINVLVLFLLEFVSFTFALAALCYCNAFIKHGRLSFRCYVQMVWSVTSVNATHSPKLLYLLFLCIEIHSSLWTWTQIYKHCRYQCCHLSVFIYFYLTWTSRREKREAFHTNCTYRDEDQRLRVYSTNWRD